MNNDVESGCLIPLGQSLVVGLVAGVVMFALGQLMEWNAPGWLAVAIGGATFLAFFIFSRNPRNDDGIGYIPPAPAAPARVRVELTQPGDGPSRHTQLADLDASPAQLRRLAEGLLGGAPFAESAWTGAGRPFSRGQFAQLRAAFLARGWADWRNPEAPAQGVILTSQGKAVVRSFAADTSLPYQVKERAQS